MRIVTFFVRYIHNNRHSSRELTAVKQPNLLGVGGRQRRISRHAIATAPASASLWFFTAVPSIILAPSGSTLNAITPPTHLAVWCPPPPVAQSRLATHESALSVHKSRSAGRGNGLWRYRAVPPVHRRSAFPRWLV